ncbi:hypothetical protein NFI96_002225 [Prochilodus magdalenae]|nr:hypothetical protein NFI96_002225 [Prochilodus magdalenae]
MSSSLAIMIMWPLRRQVDAYASWDSGDHKAMPLLFYKKQTELLDTLAMVKAREWSQKTREEVIALHKNDNGYKKIAKLLNIPRDTIGSIIRKFKLKGTVETLPGRGRKKILTATAVRYLKRNVEKNPRVTAKELKKDLSDVGTEVSAQTIRRALHNEELHARTPRRTPLLTPKNKKEKSTASMPKVMWTRHNGFGTVDCGKLQRVQGTMNSLQYQEILEENVMDKPHCPQVKKTWNSDNPSQVWSVYTKSAPVAHPGAIDEHIKSYRPLLLQLSPIWIQQS